MTRNMNVTRNPFLTLAVLMSAMMVGAIVALAGETKPAAAPAAGEAAEKDGQAVFNNACHTCHSIKPGDNRLGPSLGGIIGKKAGSSEGYAYSPAMKQAGITWDEKNLDAFIANPDSVVQGNNMKPYTGMTNAGDRATIIEYLKKGG